MNVASVLHVLIKILHDTSKSPGSKKHLEIMQAPVHFLVIPKHKNGLTQLSKSNQGHEPLLGHLLVVASKVALQGGSLHSHTLECRLNQTVGAGAGRGRVEILLPLSCDGDNTEMHP